MLLNDKIVASYVEGFSGVYIYCNHDFMEEIADKFEEIFDDEWNQAMDNAEEEYDAVCQEKEDEMDVPAFVNRDNGWLDNNRLHIVIAPLYLSMNYGARADNEFGIEALENTLKKIKEEYPDVKYEGLLAYEFCDEHAGDVINLEISSEKLPKKNNKAYDFVEDTLNMILSDEDISEIFWEKMEEQLDDAEQEDLEQILLDFQTYNVSQAFIDKLLELADDLGLVVDECDDDNE